MRQQLFQLTLVVADYDEAIAFYTQKLGFSLLEDTVLSPEKRWVRVQPPGAAPDSCSLLLARAASPEQQAAVGRQTGGRVFLFMHTDDLLRDYQRLREQGVTIRRGPVEEAYGKVLVFEDLYGNLWDLIEPPAVH